MISQILGFSVLFILVFGGMIGAVIKFTLLGSVKAKLSNRIVERRIESALNPTSGKSKTKDRKKSTQSVRETVYRIDGKFSELSKS